MKVGVIVASKFPDMDVVRERLAKGAKADCTLVVRSGDHTTLRLLDEVGAENVELRSPDKETYGNGARIARDNLMLVEVDHMLVFHAPGSGTTGYFVDKAREWPYSLSFGPKTTIVEAGEVKKRRTKGRSKAE